VRAVVVVCRLGGGRAGARRREQHSGDEERARGAAENTFAEV
jgi:hypothetical protein